MLMGNNVCVRAAGSPSSECAISATQMLCDLEAGHKKDFTRNLLIHSLWLDKRALSSFVPLQNAKNQFQSKTNKMLNNCNKVLPLKHK